MSSSDIIQKERPSACFHRYWDGVFIVVQKEILRVFLWLYEGGSEYVGDYLKTKPRGMKRLGAMEKEALRNKENPASFGITLLYTIIQHVCGLADDNADMWHNPSTPEEENSLEHTLFKLKKKRNLLSHKPQLFIHMTQDDLETHFSDLRQMCDLILRKAGQKGNKPTDDIDQSVANMKKNLDYITSKPPPSGFTAKKFALVSKQEMARKHNPSPSSKTFVLPLIHTSSKSGSYEMSLKNFPLWRCDDGSLPKATVLQGETGSGKSTISKFIFDSWMSNNDDIISDLQGFDLVIPVQCCNVSSRDLLVLLEDFMKDTIFLCDRNEILSSFFGSLRIVWLIDGFEEASKDAVEVLKSILSLQTPSSCPHLLFITTHPQKHQDLLSDILISSDKLCEVLLTGLSPEGVMSFVTNHLHLDENDLSKCQIKTDKFLRDIESQSMDIMKELKIPLKLKLILELWTEGKLQQDSGASLRHLYDTLMEANKEKLQEKLQKKYSLKADVIESRIASWMEVVYKVAFEMSMKKKFIKINNDSLMKLEKTAEGLIDPEQCMSSFLQSNTIESSSGKSYSFIHGSQQFYLSAKHIVSLMNKKKPNQILKKLLKHKLSIEDPMQRYHYYQILLQVVSNVAMQQNLQQSTATVLVDLLLLCPQFDIFEVVLCAKYSQIITKEVSRVNSYSSWLVHDQKIKAANALLQFTAPKMIAFDISTDPNGLQDLPEVLKKISKKITEVSLNIWYHSISSPSHLTSEVSSDRYLTSICSSDAKCRLSSFSGNLSLDGIHYLLNMKDVLHLFVNVSSNLILSSIIDNLKYLSRLELIQLVLMMPFITIPMPSIESTTFNLMIRLPFLDESRAEETSLALTQISNNYHGIELYDISASAAVKFIKIFEEKKVKVDHFCKRLLCKSQGEFRVKFGPVPLNRPITLFYEQWNETHVVMEEDDLEIKRETLVTHHGISPSDVQYCEGLSISTFKVTLFD